MCKVSVKKIPGYYSPFRASDPMRMSDIRSIGRSERDEFQMSVSFDDTLHVRFLDDHTGHDLARFGEPGQYERYIADRLRTQMLDFINSQIKEQVAAIAKANRPKSDDDMKYLFKESK